MSHIKDLFANKLLIALFDFSEENGSLLSLVLLKVSSSYHQFTCFFFLFFDHITSGLLNRDLNMYPHPDLLFFFVQLLCDSVQKCHIDQIKCHFSILLKTSPCLSHTAVSVLPKSVVIPEV